MNKTRKQETTGRFQTDKCYVLGHITFQLVFTSTNLKQDETCFYFSRVLKLIRNGETALNGYNPALSLGFIGGKKERINIASAQ